MKVQHEIVDAVRDEPRDDAADHRFARHRNGRLRAHVLWMVENHPEHASTAEPSLRDLPDDPEGNVQILELWNKHLQSRPNDLSVLKNAEKFFFGKDPEVADRLIHCISEKEPNNREWPAELAQLYRMFGIPDENIEKSVEKKK